MRTKPLILAKKQIKNKVKNKVRHAEHKSKVSRLEILKVIGAKHQNRAWLSLCYGKFKKNREKARTN